MRSPTTVFTKCLKIKLKVNMESQKSFLAVVWAEWELWRLMVLLHTVWESLESPVHNLISVHQADEASCCPKSEFSNETARTERSGTNLLWVCSCKPIHLISPAPWVCPAVSGRGSKTDHSLCSQKKSHFCCQSWGWPSLSQLCQHHIHHLANRSQILFCCSWSYPWTLLPFSEPQTTISPHLLITVSFHWSLVHESPPFTCWKPQLSSLLSLSLLKSSPVAAFQLWSAPFQKTESTEWEIQSCSAINEHNYSATLHCLSC